MHEMRNQRYMIDESGRYVSSFNLFKEKPVADQDCN